MSLAPVVLFVYSRLEHTIKTIESLKKNTLAKQTELFIYSDFYKKNASDGVISSVEKVRAYIDSVDGFKSVTIVKAEENKGLAKSVIFGVNEIINRYGKIIAIEDDIVTSKYFLRFMNDALTNYKDDDLIWSISGYTPKLKLGNYEHEIYIVKRGCSWGWATWKNRWNTINWDKEFYSKLLLDTEMKRNFNKTGYDMSYMLELQNEGQIDSWAIRWCYNQFVQEKYTVYPVKSFVQNIGVDNSGTHTGSTNKYDVLVTQEYTINFKRKCYVKEDKNVSEEFRKFYSPKIKILLSKYFRKLGIYKQIRNFIYSNKNK